MWRDESTQSEEHWIDVATADGAPWDQEIIDEEETKKYHEKPN